MMRILIFIAVFCVAPFTIAEELKICVLGDLRSTEVFAKMSARHKCASYCHRNKGHVKLFTTQIQGCGSHILLFGDQQCVASCVCDLPAGHVQGMRKFFGCKESSKEQQPQA